MKDVHARKLIGDILDQYRKIGISDLTDRRVPRRQAERLLCECEEEGVLVRSAGGGFIRGKKS